MLTRVAILAVAVVACAWFVLGARQARDIADATAIVSSGGPLTHDEAQRAASLLQAARTLNPDREVDVLRGRLALAEGHVRDARRILTAVTASEPDDLSAWAQLALASANDPASFYAAEIHIRHLVATFPAPR